MLCCVLRVRVPRARAVAARLWLCGRESQSGPESPARRRGETYYSYSRLCGPSRHLQSAAGQPRHARRGSRHRQAQGPVADRCLGVTVSARAVSCLSLYGGTGDLDTMVRSGFRRPVNSEQQQVEMPCEMPSLI